MVLWVKGRCWGSFARITKSSSTWATESQVDIDGCWFRIQWGYRDGCGRSGWMVVMVDAINK